MFTLRNGDAVCDLLPEVGGAVGRFAVGGRDILRPTRAGEREVRQTACFPLVPFFGRVRSGQIEFRDEHIQLPPDPGFEPNAIHGHGWRNPWRVEESSAGSAALTYEHHADAWPWHYAARQSFALTSESLRIELALTNNSQRPMPYSLGLHPYFPRTQQTVLKADVTGVWLADETITPNARAAADTLLDLAHGAPLGSAPFVDNTHFGWSHRAMIMQGDQMIALASDADFLHVFLPAGEGYFCVEPVTAMPDAFNRQDQIDSGFRALTAGATATVAMTLAVRPPW